MELICEKCWYNSYDGEQDEYFCALQLDEDEYEDILRHNFASCKYFRPDTGEYEIVRRQN